VRVTLAVAVRILVVPLAGHIAAGGLARQVVLALAPGIFPMLAVNQLVYNLYIL